MTQECVIANAPAIALPRQEHEGAAWWWRGTTMQGASTADGFAFCPYEFGSLEHDNWVAGYASQAFCPDLIEKQTEPEPA